MALQIAEQMSDYLLRGAITNAVNFPSITAEEAPRLTPFITLAEKLGSFAGQLNSGVDGPVMIDKLLESSDTNQGFDARTGRAST